MLLAGTATPRPESWAALPRLELPERVDGAPLPPVELLDMRERERRSGPLHPRPGRPWRRSPAGRRRRSCCVNRRGFSPHLSCRECGEAVGLPACDVSLVLHRGEGPVGCHHCGHTEPLPDANARRAARSRSSATAPAPSGSRNSWRSSSRPPRCSASTPTPRRAARARHARDPLRLRAGRRRGPARHPDGRQGPRLPRRRRSACSSTPTPTLRFPDLRAEERTFALVAQLAGRSGRGAARRAGAWSRRSRPTADADRAAPPPRRPRLPRRRAASGARELGYPPFAA